MVSRGENLGEATYRLTVDSQGFDKGMAGAEDRTKQRLERMSSQTRQLGAAFTVAGGLAVAALGSMASAASDLEESVNAVNVVFGEGASTILEFGEKSAEAVGLAQSDFQQLATGTGALLQNFGQSQEEAAEKTLLLTQRAADLASVHNTDVKDALFAVNAALRGETEPLRRYAADVTDATLQAHLLSKGIDTQVSSMSQQEKGMLRLEVIMEQTSAVQGDFQNTSDSMANSTRIALAEFKDLRAELGQHLLPLIGQILQPIIKMVRSIKDWAEENPRLAKTVILIAGGLGILALALGGVLLAVSVLTGAIATMGVTAAVATGGITIAIGLLVAGGVALIANWDKVKRFGIRVWNSLLDITESTANRILDVVNELTRGFRNNLANILEAVQAVSGAVGIDLPDAMDIFIEKLREGFPELDLQRAKLEEVKEAQEEVKEATEETTAAIEAQTEAMAGHLLTVQNQRTAVEQFKDAYREQTDAAIARLEREEQIAREEEQLTQDRLAIIEDLTKDFHEENLKAEAAYQKKVIDLKIRHGEKILELDRREKQALDDAQENHWAKVSDLQSTAVADYEDTFVSEAEDIADAESRYSERRAEAEKAYQEEISNIHARYANARAKAEADYRADMLSLQNKFREDSAKAERRYRQDVADLENDFANDSRKAQVDHQRDLDSLVEDHHRDRERELKSHMGRLQSIRERALQRASDAETDRNRDQEDINRDYERAVEDLRRRLGEQFFDTPDADIMGILSQVGADTELVEAHMEGMAELTRDRDRALEDLEIDHSRKLADIALERARSEEEARRVHLEKLTLMETEHRLRVEESEMLYRWEEEERLREHRFRLAELELDKQRADQERLRAHNLAMSNRETAHQQAMSALDTAHKEALKEAQQEFQAERMEDFTEHEQRLNEIARNYEEERATILENYETDRVAAVERHNEDVAAIEEVAAEKRLLARIEHDEILLRWQEQYEDEAEARRVEHWRELDRISKEWADKVADTVREALQRAFAAVKKLEAMVRAARSGGDIPKGMPGLASGGLVRQPTMAMLAETGTPEAVIPLPQLSRMMHGDGKNIVVVLEGDLEPLSGFVTGKVLESNIRGRQDVIRSGGRR